jgi:polyhydroxyalkanoate synthesis regulator phasin
MEERALEQFTAKVTKNVKSELSELMDSGSFKTVNQMIETLIENYNLPRKVAEANTAKMIEIQNANNELTERCSNLDKSYISIVEEFEAQKAENECLRGKVEALNRKLSDAENKIPKENTMIIEVNEFQMKVLQSLCARENKKRKRTDLTPEIFVMFVIEEMLVNANVFTIDVLSSSELKRIKKEVEGLENDWQTDY